MRQLGNKVKQWVSVPNIKINASVYIWCKYEWVKAGIKVVRIELMRLKNYNFDINFSYGQITWNISYRKIEFRYNL